MNVKKGGSFCKESGNVADKRYGEVGQRSWRDVRCLAGFPLQVDGFGLWGVILPR